MTAPRVIGAGISGLTAGLYLGAPVIESSDRAGGNVRTETIDDCIVDWGPNGFLDNEPATLALVKKLGLTDRLVRARECAAVRYIWRAEKLHKLPSKPQQFLVSGCLPLLGRLRCLLEPFVRRQTGPPAPKRGARRRDGDVSDTGAPGEPGESDETDESVWGFARRRLGRAAADVLVDAFVTGVFAGDPKRLSVRSAFPKLKALEEKHGSLMRGAKGGGFGPRGTLTSLRGGIGELTDALAARVDLRLASPSVSFLADSDPSQVCAAPAARTADLADGSAGLGELAAALREIPTAPVAVAAFAVDDPLDVPDAFGFLAPHGQGLRVLGVLYSSSIFPDRAPKGVRLFRVMIGGRRDPEAVSLDDGALREICARDLRRAWGTWKEPRWFRVFRYRRGLAQYELGHRARLARIEAACPPWLTLIGASYRGTSLNACVKEAASLGEQARRSSG